VGTILCPVSGGHTVFLGKHCSAILRPVGATMSGRWQRFKIEPGMFEHAAGLVQELGLRWKSSDVELSLEGSRQSSITCGAWTRLRPLVKHAGPR